MKNKFLHFGMKLKFLDKSIETRKAASPLFFMKGRLPPMEPRNPPCHFQDIEGFRLPLQDHEGLSGEAQSRMDTHGLPVEIEVEKTLA